MSASYTANWQGHLTHGVWNHYAVVIDDAAGFNTIYQNGVQHAGRNYTSGTYAYTGTQNLAVGAQGSAGGSIATLHYDMDDFRMYGRALTQAEIQAAMALPEHELPRAEAQARPPKGIGPLIDLLRVLLKLRAEDSDVAQRLIANGGDLEAIALDDDADVPALKGWRHEIFGAEALALKRGEIGIAVRNRRTTVVPLGPAA